MAAAELLLCICSIEGVLQADLGSWVGCADLGPDVLRCDAGSDSWHDGACQQDGCSNGSSSSLSQLGGLLQANNTAHGWHWCCYMQ